MIMIDNIIFSIQKSGGVSVVWYEFIKRCLESPLYNFRFFEGIDKAKNENIFRNQLSINYNQVVIDDSKLPIKIKRYLNPKLKIKNDYIFHSTYYRTSRDKKAINIVTVHDFTYEICKKNVIKGFLHKLQKKRALQKADYLICISENTKKDVIRFFPKIDPEKIFIIYNGVSEEYYPIPNLQNSSTPYKHMSYIVFIGSRETYKQYDLALKSVANTKLNFLIIGGGRLSKKEQKDLDQLIGPERYRQEVNVSNKRLNEIYNSAYCLLYPSVYEGFGIPIIEAQSSGCPVIAYNGSSIPEIIGDLSLTFNELSTQAIVEKISMLRDDKLREDQIKKGLLNSKRFSWDKTFRETLEIYKTVIKEHNSIENKAIME